MGTAACRYCGQIYMIDYEDPDWLAAKGDMSLVATRRCTCEGALHFATMERVSDRAEENIDEAFSDNSNIAALLKAAVPYLVSEAITSLSISKPGLKGKLTRTLNNNIKVSRTNSETKVYEE